MLDSLDKFEAVAEGELVIKLHPDEVPVLRESVTAVAKESIAALAPRYGFTPRGPILIEMFPKHDDFAVRTLGLPGMVGALGACFGRVVTLDSPRARPPGEFNWRATLWHEMAHVFALQLSEQRVPRWVTEGASVYEERRANPSWGREGEHHFLQAYARDELIPLKELNSGFSSARTINLAYHQASLVVEHLIGRFGDAGFQKFLKAFATGQTPDAALQGTFGLSMADLQTSFDQYLTERFGQARTALKPIEDEKEDGKDGKEKEEKSTDAPADDTTSVVARADRHPGNYVLQLQAGRQLLDQGRLDDARRVLERAVALVPQTMGDESPRMALADIAVKQGQAGRARAELVKVLKEGHTAIEAARKLLALALEATDHDEARQAAERIVALDPFDGSARTELGRQAMAREDVATALRELELALKLGPRDPAASHTDLAEAYLLAGQPDPAKRHLLSALENAPRYERAQELLLKIVDGR
jgi:tetratricopeptide (TPR) repeat protein